MAHLSGVFRLGRDAEKIEGPRGNFLTLSLAYDAFIDGENKSQWIRATLGGERAEKALASLTRGTFIEAVVKDVRVAEFTDREGNKRATLEGRMIDFSFVGARKTEPASESHA